MATEFKCLSAIFLKLYFCQSSVVSVTKTYEFAGEEVKVTETVPADSCKAAEQADTKSDEPVVTPAAVSQETKKTKLVAKCIRASPDKRIVSAANLKIFSPTKYTQVVITLPVVIQ